MNENVNHFFMKKIIDFTTGAILAIGAASIIYHFNVGSEISGFVKQMVIRMVPWIDLDVYT